LDGTPPPGGQSDAQTCPSRHPRTQSVPGAVETFTPPSTTEYSSLKSQLSEVTGDAVEL
jgi:hypothetical protein